MNEHKFLQDVNIDGKLIVSEIFTVGGNVNISGGAQTGSDFTVGGRLYVGEGGTTALPGIVFADEPDSNTGIYYIANNQLGFSAGGSRQLTIRDTGLILKRNASIAVDGISDNVFTSTDKDLCTGTAILSFGSSISGNLQTQINGLSGDYVLKTGDVISGDLQVTGDLESSALRYLDASTGGAFNTYIGNLVAGSASGDGNVGIGYASLQDLTTGDSNFALGYLALANITNTNSNIAIGSRALELNSVSADNVAIGTSAGRNSSVMDSVMIGTESGKDNTGGFLTAVGYWSAKVTTNGYQSTCIGARAGENTGLRCVHLGYLAGATDTGNDKLHIANTSAKTLIYGEFNNNLVRINGDLEASEGNVSTEFSSSDAGVYAYRSDGRAVSMVAGSDSGNLIFDNGGVLRIQSQLRSSMDSKNSSNRTILFEMSNSTSQFMNNLQVDQNLTVAGDLIVEGTTTTVNSQEVLIEDNIITLNSSLSGNPPSFLESGIKVNRGDEDPYFFTFREIDLTFTIGVSGISGDNRQAVATREDAPNSNAFAFWNNSENRFDTSSLFTTNTIVTDSKLAGISGNLQDQITGLVAISGDHETRLDSLEDGTTLDSRYVNVDGDIMTGNLAVQGQAYSETNSLSISGSIINTDLDTGNVHTFTIDVSGATLANPTNTKNGATYIWMVKQDGIGGRTLDYGSNFKFPGGTTPTLTAISGSVDILSCVSDGTNLYCNMANDFQ